MYMLGYSVWCICGANVVSIWFVLEMKPNQKEKKKLHSLLVTRKYLLSYGAPLVAIYWQMLCSSHVVEQVTVMTVRYFLANF